MTVPIRRFERGASGLGFYEFLEARGIRTMQAGNSFKVWMPGSRKPRNMTQRALVGLVDVERVKAGLEPIVKQSEGR